MAAVIPQSCRGGEPKEPPTARTAGEIDRCGQARVSLNMQIATESRKAHVNE